VSRNGAPTHLVLIDTCVWSPFFDGRKSREKTAVEILLDEDRAALIGPLLAEVLHGFRRDDRADWAASYLRGLHYFEVAWEDSRQAASLGRRMAARGHKLPLVDLTVAAIAMRTDAAVYSTDPHFDLIPDLRRFAPKGD
jgi:predicted nucleic acid-binding protein